MKIYQNTKQLQKQILSPAMQQSIELLQLPIGELGAAINTEIESNPTLESDDVETTLSRYINDIINNKIGSEQNSFAQVSDSYFSDDDQNDERPIFKNVTLEDHLLKQVRVELLTPEEVRIGETLISYINEDGYFEGNMLDIAHTLGLEKTDALEEVLKKIQDFDPAGIGARHLRECLIAQVPSRFNGHSDIVSLIINNHLDDLAMKKFDVIAKKLNLNIEAVKNFAKEIATLEPKPARRFSEAPLNLYIKPDITIVEETGSYIAQVNNEYIPQLRVSAAYRNMLKQPNCTVEETDFIKEKIKNALLFIKSVEQRQNTIKQIADYIVTNQQEFFKEGYSALKPMTLKDIATTIDRNESTVSRAICNKYMDSPQGILPLKYFFSQGVAQSSEDDTVLSNRSIKEELVTIVEEENKAKPLSDQDILEVLGKRQIKVARRTISKYRKELKILPSHMRKE